MYNNVDVPKDINNKTDYKAIYNRIEKDIENTKDIRKRALYVELLEKFKENEKTEKMLDSIDEVAGERLFRLVKAYSLKPGDTE